MYLGCFIDHSACQSATYVTVRMMIGWRLFILFKFFWLFNFDAKWSTQSSFDHDWRIEHPGYIIWLTAYIIMNELLLLNLFINNSFYFESSTILQRQRDGGFSNIFQSPDLICCRTASFGCLFGTFVKCFQTYAKQNEWTHPAISLHVWVCISLQAK